MRWTVWIAEFIVAILKGIFGRIGQEEYRVDKPKDDHAGVGDDELLADLGLPGADAGATDADGIRVSDTGQAPAVPEQYYRDRPAS